MAQVVRVFSIDAFKKLINTKFLLIKKGYNGSYSAINDHSVRVAAVSDNAIKAIQEGKPLMVLQMYSNKSIWYLIVSSVKNPPDVVVI